MTGLPIPARRSRRRWLAAGAALAAAAFAPRPRAAGGEWLFVVHPFDTPTRLFTRFRPLALYLGGALGRPLRLTIAGTYDEQIAMITDGRAQLAYIGPTPYVKARERAPVEILAGEAEGGQAFYQSAIVVREDSPIRALADLRRRRVAFGAEISMSSSVAPKRMLAQAGVALDDLAGHTHLDRHERVALSVLHGDFDAGGLRLDIAKTYLARGLRVLAVSQPLPPHVIVAGPAVPPADRQRARVALLHPDEAGLAAFRALGEKTHFVAVGDDQFHAVRRMIRERGSPP